MIYIEKKSVVPLPAASGSISDTTNITDKVTNTYSARVIEEMLSEIPLIRSGSIVVIPSGTPYALMFSEEELLEMFGIDTIDYDKLSGSVSNGDYTANSTHVTGLLINKSLKRIYAGLNASISNNIRINYTLFYNR